MHSQQDEQFLDRKRLSRVIRSYSVVGVGALAVMMFLTGADVISRYMFNAPVKGAFELTEFLLAMLVACTIARCSLHKGHVSVTFILARLPIRAQGVINIITIILSLGLFILITWRSFVFARILLASGSTSATLLIPMFPFAIVLGFGISLLCLVLAFDLIDCVSRFLKE